MIIEQIDKEEFEREKSYWDAINKFIDDFNKEAKKQNKKWFAYIEFEQYPLIAKKFLKIIIMEFQITYNNYSGKFFFVDNDYMISKQAVEANKEFLKYYPEFKPILEKIPQKFMIRKEDNFYEKNNKES